MSNLLWIRLVSCWDPMHVRTRGAGLWVLVSCPAGKIEGKIRLVTLRTILDTCSNFHKFRQEFERANRNATLFNHCISEDRKCELHLHSFTILASMWLQLRQLTPWLHSAEYVPVPRIVRNVTRQIFRPIFFQLGTRLGSLRLTQAHSKDKKLSPSLKNSFLSVSRPKTCLVAWKASQKYRTRSNTD